MNPGARSYLAFTLSYLIAASPALGNEPTARGSQPAAAAPGQLKEFESFRLTMEALVATLQKQGTTDGLSLEEKDPFSLLGQTVVTGSGTAQEVHTDISRFNLDHQNEHVPPGTLSRDLLVSLAEGGYRLELGFSKSSYRHSLRLSCGARVISFSFDSEYVVMLDEHGRVYAIALTELEDAIFKTSIPVVPLTVAPGVLSVQIVRRYVNPLDTSSSGPLRSLYPGETADHPAVDRPTHKILQHLEAATQAIQPPARTRPYDVFHAGDLLLVGADGLPMTLPREEMALSVAERLSYLHAMLQVLSTDNPAALGINQLSAVADDILSSPEMVMNFFHGGILESLVDTDPKMIEGAALHSLAVSRDSGRDMFTGQEWMEAHREYASLVDRVAASLKDKPTGTWLNSLVRKTLEGSLALQSSVRAMNFSEAMKRAKSAILNPNAWAVGLFGAAVWKSATLRRLVTPEVLTDPAYRELLMYSAASQATFPFIIYGLAAMVAPLTRYKALEIPAIAGIRAYARVFQISPFRVMAAALRQRPMYRGLKRGVITGPIALGKGPAREANVAAANERVLAHFRRLAAVNLATIKAAKVLESGSAPGLSAADETRLEQLLTSTDPAQVRTSQEAETFDAHLDEVKAEMEELLRGLPDPLAGRQFLLGRVAKIIGNMNERVYNNLSHAEPDEFAAKLIRNGFWIDYLLSVGTEATFGAFADLSKPKDLHAQQGTFLWTHRMVTTGHSEQCMIHLMRSAAGIHLQWSGASASVNIQHTPLELRRLAKEQTPKQQGYFLSHAKLLGYVADIEGTAPGTLLYDYMIYQKLALLQSSIMMAMLPRLFILNQSLNDAMKGVLVFSALGLWAYGFPWPIISGALKRANAEINERLAKMQTAQVQIAQGERLNDDDKVRQGSQTLQDLWQGDETERPLDARTLLEASLKNPGDFGVATEFNGSTYNAWIIGGSVATTVLATYLLRSTMNGIDAIPWHGINWTDWNYVGNIPVGDGVDGIIFKAGVLMTVAAGAGQLVLNRWLKKRRLQRALQRIDSDSAEGKAELERLEFDAQQAQEKLANFGPWSFLKNVGKASTVRVAKWIAKTECRGFFL